MNFKDNFLTKTDRLGIGIASFIAITCSAWLYFDYYKSDSTVANLVSIGKITPLKSYSRLKHAEGFTWFDINSSNPVYNGDYIFTGNDSEAEIKLLDGSIIKLDPATLIVLNYKDKLNLDLQFGSFSGDLKSDALLKAGKDNFQLGKSNFNATKNSESLDFELQSGLAKLGNIELKKGSQHINDGKLIPLEKKLELIKPINKSWVWLSPNENLNLEWKGPVNVSYTVEFSTSPSFNKILFFEKTNSNKILIPFSFYQTDIYWRVTALENENKKISSPVFSFIAQPNIAPDLIKPDHEANLQSDITLKSKNKGIDFVWRDQSEIWANFELEIASDSGFKNIILKKEFIETSEAPAIIEKTGDYFWRVRGVLPDKNQFSHWSKTRKFFIKVSTPEPLSPPTLITKDVSFEILPRDLVNFDESQNTIFLDETTGSPKLDWTTTENAYGYKVNFYLDKEKKQFFKKILVKKDQLFMQKPNIGQFYWNVQTVFKDKSLGPESDLARLEVRLPYPRPNETPPLNHIIDYKDREKDQFFDVSWKAFPLKKGYEVQWSLDKNFRNSKSVLTVKDTQKLLLPNESTTIYWRVRASNRDKSPFSPFSPTQSLIYERKIINIPTEVIEDQAKKLASINSPPPVDAPTILQPSLSKVYLKTKDQEAFVFMKWEYKNAYDSFDLEIAQDKEFKDLLTKENTTDTKFILNKSLNPGDYFWRIRVNLGGEGKAWSPSHLFKVKNID